MKYLIRILASIILSVLIGGFVLAKDDLSQKIFIIPQFSTEASNEATNDRIKELEKEVKQLKNKMNQLEKQLLNKAGLTHQHTCSYSGGSSVYCY
jgi:hypothetical protein